MKPWTNIKSAFGAMRHERASGGDGSNPFFQTFLQYIFRMFSGARINYTAEIEDLTQSQLIMAEVNFWGRTLPEAKLEVARPKTDGTNKLVPDHPVIKFFKRPNGHL